MDKFDQKAQNVVAMSRFQPESGFSAIAQVEAYWEGLRGNRMVPKRSDVDPRGIEKALEYAFIVERISPGIARLRIAGSHLSEVMGMEVRGMPLTALFTPPARRMVSDLLEEVFQTPGTVNFNLTAAAAPGRPAGEARMVLLPLKSDLGDISRVLGCVVYRGEIGLAPRRMDVVSHDFTRLLPGRDLEPPEDPVVPREPASKKKVPGFAEPDQNFKARPLRRPPYLRVVKSDE